MVFGLTSRGRDFHDPLLSWFGSTCRPAIPCRLNLLVELPSCRAHPGRGRSLRHLSPELGPRCRGIKEELRGQIYYSSIAADPLPSHVSSRHVHCSYPSDATNAKGFCSWPSTPYSTEGPGRINRSVPFTPFLPIDMNSAMSCRFLAVGPGCQAEAAVR